MAKRSVFTPESARRIAAAVHKVEGEQNQPLRFRGQSVSPQDPWGFAFRNDSGETVPAYACVEITGTTNLGSSYGGVVLVGNKPSRFGAQYSHALNSRSEVANGEIGTCYLCDSAGYFAGGYPIALYDNANSPVFGQMWGPRSGSWKLNASTGGFSVIGTIDTTNHYMIVRHAPMLVLTGYVITSDIAVGSNGNVSCGWLLSNTGIHTTGNEVFNGLDVAAVVGSFVICDYIPSDSPALWLIKQTFYTCP